MYGLETWGMDGCTMEAAKKMIKFMTNLLEVGLELQRRCDGQHKHQELTWKRAQWAARYPDELCRAICRGLMTEMRNEKLMVKMLVSMTASDVIQEFNDARSEGRGHKEVQEA